MTAPLLPSQEGRSIIGDRVHHTVSLILSFPYLSVSLLSLPSSDLSHCIG